MVNLIQAPETRLWKGAVGDINSNAARDYIETKVITILDWSACTPDLYPIENLWNQLKRRINVLRDYTQNFEHQHNR